VKRLPFFFIGLLLLFINLVVPVFLQELSTAGVIFFNGRNTFILGGLLGIPVGVVAIYLVYMRSKDAGKVYPIFWIWLLASTVSVSCYFISFLISNSLNSYFYYGSDLICLGIGVYLTFVSSAPEEIMVKSSF
jgi:hypothetical protein